MPRLSLAGLAVSTALLVPGWSCAPSTPRLPSPDRTTTTPRVPVPPLPGTAGGAPGGDTGTGNCSLQKAEQAIAFCDTFDVSHNGGTRTGDLDPVLWGVSRVGPFDSGNGELNWIPDSTMAGCGVNGTVAPPLDVRVCNGQLVESVDDGHTVVNLDMYPKQPFDFTGRTGTAGFDVSADSQGNHGAWPEFIITDKPVPGERLDISQIVPPAAANEIGFALDEGCEATTNTTGIGKIYVTRNNVYQNLTFTATGCVTRGSSASMNHFEFRVSQNHVEVWGTDAGSTTLKQIAYADNVGLSFTKGLVWMTDSHYNACKLAGYNQCDHTFFWDNLAFDGPKTYRDLGFDVPDATARLSINGQGNGTNTGYRLDTGSKTFTISGVRQDHTPEKAQVVLNFYTRDQNVVPTLSVNGNPAIVTPWPFDATTNTFRSISIPVTLSEINIGGTNTLTFTSTDHSTILANMSIILVNAASVP